MEEPEERRELFYFGFVLLSAVLVMWHNRQGNCTYYSTYECRSHVFVYGVRLKLFSFTHSELVSHEGSACTHKQFSTASSAPTNKSANSA